MLARGRAQVVLQLAGVILREILELYPPNAGGPFAAEKTLESALSGVFIEDLVGKPEQFAVLALGIIELGAGGRERRLQAIAIGGHVLQVPAGGRQAVTGFTQALRGALQTSIEVLPLALAGGETPGGGSKFRPGPFVARLLLGKRRAQGGRFGAELGEFGFGRDLLRIHLFEQGLCTRQRSTRSVISTRLLRAHGSCEYQHKNPEQVTPEVTLPDGARHAVRSAH